MKFLFAVVMSLFCVSAFAGITVNTDGLTDLQKAEIAKTVEQLKANASSTALQPEKVAEVAEKWANIGEQFGKMIGSAAKEVGVAANEFLQTPVGILTATVIVFHYMGSPIIHVTVGLLILAVGLMLMT